MIQGYSALEMMYAWVAKEETREERKQMPAAVQRGDKNKTDLPIRY